MQVQTVISFSRGEVQKILADYINENFAINGTVSPAEVKFSVSAGYDDPRGGYEAPSMNSADVKVTLSSIKK